MEQKVIDASVAVKWFIPEPHSDKAVELLHSFRKKELDLTAPDHIVAEVGNALWHRSTLRKEISPLEASESYADFLAVGLRLYPAPPLVEAALKLAAQERESVYDMLYVALAVQFDCELITADEKLINKLKKKFSLVRWVGDL